MKATIAVITGYVLWTVLWLAGNAGFRAGGLTPADQSIAIESVRALLALLCLSVVASIFSGYIIGMIAPSTRAHYICAALLLATGIVAQWGVRSLLPVWYHTVFLILIIPMVVIGAKMSVISKG
jgi:hypothetical protein